MDAFNAAEKNRPLLAINHAWLGTLPCVDVLDADALQERYRAYEVMDEQRAQLKAAAERASIARRSPFEIALHAWCEQSGNAFERFTAFSNGVHFRAGGKHFRADEIDGRLVIFDDEKGQIAALPIEKPAVTKTKTKGGKRIAKAMVKKAAKAIAKKSAKKPAKAQAVRATVKTTTKAKTKAKARPKALRNPARPVRKPVKVSSRATKTKGR